jgi:phosphoribosylformylglycinamidine synthase
MTPFTTLFKRNQKIRIPIAHGEGKYVADDQTLKELRQKNQIVLTYLNQNPNGSFESIAAICNPQGNVVGMMPHPERASERILSSAAGSTDGSTIFQSLMHHLGDMKRPNDLRSKS